MPVTGNPIPAGAWFRVSTGAQDEASQIPDVEKHCAARGYGIARRYTVHGKSAYHGEHQKDLDEALADARSGTIKVLVIWHSSRIERRPGKALLDVLAEFAEAGCRVESVQEPTLGQLDFGGQVSTFLAGLMNHEKSRLISEQVRIKHDALREAGSFIGRPPLLYEVVRLDGGRKTIAPTPEGTKYIPLILQRIIDGESLATVCRWLEAETGRPWWPRSLAGLVRNPVLVGYRCEYDNPHRKTYGRVLHECTPAVDAGLWQLANDRLSDAPRRGPRVAGRAMLTGVIFCPSCPDSPMYRITTGGGKRGKARIAYYRCSGRGANRKGCGNLVRCEAADAAVQHIAATTFKHRKVTVTVHIPGSSQRGELAGIAFQLKQLGAAYAAEQIGDAEHAGQLAALAAERKRLKALPAVPDRWEETELDETYADRWNAADPSGRGDWLKAQGFRVEACRDYVRLSQPGHPRQVTATVTLTTGKAAA